MVHVLIESKYTWTLSVMRQQGKSQNRCFKKIKHPKFSEKRAFLHPERTRTCAYEGKEMLVFRQIWCVLFS